MRDDQWQQAFDAGRAEADRELLAILSAFVTALTGDKDRSYSIATSTIAGTHVGKNVEEVLPLGDARRALAGHDINGIELPLRNIEASITEYLRAWEGSARGDAFSIALRAVQDERAKYHAK